MTRHSWRALLLAAAGGAGACALALDWDPAGLPCDESKKCADTYSCLVNRCVEEGSLPLETTCSQPEQCEGYPDVTCGSNPFTCRTKCSDLFDARGNCSADEYCRPERHREFEDQWIGTCFPSECLRESDCRSDRVCVSISPSAGACLVECTYSFTTGEYRDTCGSSLETEQYCQPIGRQDEQKLVCLEAIGEQRASLGGPCDPVRNPCEESMVCVDSVCREYCSTTLNNCDTGLCQAFDNLGVELFAACIP